MKFCAGPNIFGYTYVRALYRSYADALCVDGMSQATFEMATGSLLLELECRLEHLCFSFFLPSWCFFFLFSRLYTPLKHKANRHAGGKTGPHMVYTYCHTSGPRRVYQARQCCTITWGIVWYVSEDDIVAFEV